MKEGRRQAWLLLTKPTDASFLPRTPLQAQQQWYSARCVSGLCPDRGGGAFFIGHTLPYAIASSKTPSRGLLCRLQDSLLWSIASDSSLLLLDSLYPAVHLQSSHYNTISLSRQRRNVSFKGGTNISRYFWNICSGGNVYYGGPNITWQALLGLKRFAHWKFYTW